MTQEIPIFIINLKKDIDKRKHMEALCKQHALSYQFTDAVYGKELSASVLSTVYKKEESIYAVGRELAKGEIGCALSHLNIYKQMLEENIDKAIILEDDILIEDNFSSIISSIDKFPDNWEVILLGYNTGVRKDKATPSSFWDQTQITPHHNIVRLIQTAFGTHAYLLNLQGAKRLIEQLHIIKKPIDLYTGDDRHINLYAISPRLARLHPELSKQSTILDERNEKTIHDRRKKTLANKLKLEFYRPFTQFFDKINTFQKQLIRPSKYTGV